MQLLHMKPQLCWLRRAYWKYVDERQTITCVTDVSHYYVSERRKSGGRERSVEREAAERRAGVTKIGLSGELCRSRSAHMLCFSSTRYGTRRVLEYQIKIPHYSLMLPFSTSVRHFATAVGICAATNPL